MVPPLGCCPVCGTPTRRRPSAKQPDRCFPCSMAVMVQALSEVASRQGPRYEAAVANGHLGGRPRKPRDSPDQLQLPGT